MFIECYLNNGIQYLRLVRSIRKPMKKDPTRMTSYKVTQLSIGPVSRFDDGKPDYVGRLKRSFREGSPLIPELKKYCDEPDVPGRKRGEAKTDLFASAFAHPKNCSQVLLDRIFHGLGLDSLFASIKSASKIEYPLADYVRLLTFGRILSPASKIATASQNGDYLRPIVKDDGYKYHVYDTLDVIYDKRLQIMERMNSSIQKGIGRDTSQLFYDVTNYYFEIGDPDDDTCDAEGKMIEKGIRKNGVSKEQRQLPIVQMSMFLDNSGIPVSIAMYPGNTLDFQTAVPSYDDTIRKMGIRGRFIFIADRGICTGPIMWDLLRHGNGYIISKPLKKAKTVLQDWVLDQSDYISTSENFRYKSKIITAKIVGDDKKTHEVKQQVVAYWSRSFYERDMAEHKRFLGFIRKLKESPASFRVTKAQAGKLKRFLSDDVTNKDTGEVISSKKLIAMIDSDKLERFVGLMGYYVIVTSELDMDPRAVIDKYHGLSRIENQFEEMKGTLETRPIHVYKKEHIYAHLLICMIALVMVRLIQHKYLVKNPPAKDDPRDWTYGITGERVQRALNRWKAIQTGEDAYWLTDIDDPDLSAILDAFDIKLPTKQYSYGELQRIKTKIKVF